MGDLKLVKRLTEGDILLVSEKGFKHSINRILGSSRWHHALLYIGKSKVLEVTPKNGCHISKLDLTKDCYKAYKAIRHNKLTAATRKKLAAEAVKIFLGKRFSWRQLIKVFFRRLWTGKITKTVFYQPRYKCKVKSITCSNLVAMIYHIYGHDVSDKWAPEYVLPRDYDELGKEFEIVFEKNRKEADVALEDKNQKF